MTSRQPATELQRCISAALASSHRAGPGPRTRSIICAGVAAVALSPLPGTALTLGELATGSRLGQPLKATIPVRLAPGEMLNDGCVSPGVEARALSGPQGLRLSVPAAQGPGDFQIAVSTARALVEPMYEIAVRIDCQGTPRLLRHYVLMLDLPGLAPVLPAAPGESAPRATMAGASRSQPVVRSPERPRRPAPAPRVARNRDPITAGSRYRVAAGDTLSTIAARVAGRPENSTWELAERIFAANPAAFIRNNPDLIKLGHEIRIPELSPAPAIVATEPPGLASAAGPASVPATPENESAAATPATPATTATMVTTSPASEGREPIGTLVGGLATQSEAAVTASGTASSAQLLPEAASQAQEAGTGNPQAESSAVAEAETPVPAPVTLSSSRPAQLHPLLAVLLGVVLGVFLSVGLLRARVLERVSALLRRGQGHRTGRSQADTFVDTDAWLEPTDTAIGAVPVRTPAEETYVVEIGEPEPSTELEVEGTDALDPDVVAIPERTDDDVAALAEADEPSAEFADVFDEALDEVPSRPDLPLVEVLAETAETVEQPVAGPTEELPHFNSSDLGFDDEAVTAELASLDSDDALFGDGELAALESVSGDETRLSATLQEALSLLDQDYEEELTASQVVDRQAIEEALSDEDAAELQRKLGS